MWYLHGCFLANAFRSLCHTAVIQCLSNEIPPVLFFFFFRGYGSKWLSPKLNWLMWVIPFGLIVTWMSSWSLCILCMCDIHIHIHIKSKMDTENAQHFVSQWPLQPATCQRFHKSKICSCWAPGKRRLAPLGRKTAPAIRHPCRGTGHGWNLKPPNIWRLIEIYGMGFTTFYNLNKSDDIFLNVHRISACPGTTVFTCPVSGPLYLGSGHQNTGGLSQVWSLLRMKQPFIWSAGPWMPWIPWIPCISVVLDRSLPTLFRSKIVLRLAVWRARAPLLTFGQ